MALKRRLTDQEYPFLRVIRRRTSRYAVKSVCVPDEKDDDVQSQTGSNDPVYDMILIDYDVEDEVESPIIHEDELKAIIPQLPGIIETQKLQARQQEKNERQKRKQKQQEENAVWDAVWDYYEKQSEKQQKSEQQQKQEEKQQNMTVIDYDEIESPVSEEDDTLELEAEEEERLLARKRRHNKQEEKQQKMNDVWDETWCNE